MTDNQPTDCHFDDTSMLRTVHREQVMILAGGRALLLMAAHPVVFEGFFAATKAKSDPFARLERTAVVLGKITYGSKESADRATAFVRKMHRSATGALPGPGRQIPCRDPLFGCRPRVALLGLGEPDRLVPAGL